jgi:putative DNA modification/repair radical SAM protein
MNTLEKIEVLGNSAKYDVCASTSCAPKAVRSSIKGDDRVGSLTNGGICHSFTPDGRCVSLFKVLMTNICNGDCKYCVNSCSMDTRRAAFTPDELKDTFLKLYRQNYVEGLFLSSGVMRSADETESDLLDIVEGLRKDNFRGYVHLKVMPGTDRSLIKDATKVADRVSLNLEAPNRLRFQEISSTKDFKIDLIRRMRWMQKEIDLERSSGQTTQFVVGACEESDVEILNTVDDVYKKLELKRSYFSAFIPVSGTSLETQARTPLLREHRLYQCDFLMRKYGFEKDELVFDDGFIDLGMDPKMKFALENRELFPLEINDASYDELLKVPGIGPQSAGRIYHVLEEGHRFTSLNELENMGIVMKRATSFISVNGARQTNLSSFPNGS